MTKTRTVKPKTDKAVRVLQAVIRGEGAGVAQEFARIALEELRGQRRDVPENWLMPTKRQAQVLTLIKTMNRDLGCSPTFGEIAAKLRVSRPTAFGHVVELEKRGFLRRCGVNRHRNIALTDKGRKVTVTSASRRYTTEDQP